MTSNPQITIDADLMSEIAEHCANTGREDLSNRILAEFPLPKPSESGQPQEIRICTDGACSGNPGPGGWAVVIENNYLHPMSGGELETTNNRMEMTAMLNALTFAAEVKGGARILIRTDSKYVLDGLTSWIKGWKARDWRKSNGKPVENQDLWKRLDAAYEAAAKTKDVEIRHVKGHAGDPWNEACDKLAVAARIQVAETGKGF